ncbi:MAG: glycyl-radical enzyme activating protein [Pseudomonadota bacterium]
MTQTQGFLFDIQGFSIYDGPGCRTVFFLKGCNLNCYWCSNPEGISQKHDLMFFENKCQSTCNACIEKCEQKAISKSNNTNNLIINKDYCQDCKNYECIESCNYSALSKIGFCKTSDELMKIVNRDRDFWGKSGGITLSGGEPLIQHDFCYEFLKKCHVAYIHTAIETCGNIKWSIFENILPYINFIFFDLKHMDNSMHIKGTGSSNVLILENAKKLAAFSNLELIFRFPLIPFYNDGKENIIKTAMFLKQIGKNEINILPFHNFGESKYKSLLLKDKSALSPLPNNDITEKIKDIFLENEIKCHLGNNTPF